MYVKSLCPWPYTPEIQQSYVNTVQTSRVSVGRHKLNNDLRKILICTFWQLFWRCLDHWLGGNGTTCFIVSLLAMYVHNINSWKQVAKPNEYFVKVLRFSSWHNLSSNTRKTSRLFELRSIVRKLLGYNFLMKSLNSIRWEVFLVFSDSPTNLKTAVYKSHLHWTLTL